MFARIEPDQMKERLAFYEAAMREAGWDEAKIQHNLDETSILRSVYVAETDEQAQEDVRNPTYLQHAHLSHVRSTYNPKDVDMRERAKFIWTRPDVTADEAVADLMSRGFLYGSPETVARQIGQLHEAGVRHVMCSFTWGAMDHDKVIKSMERFATQVMPRYTADAVTMA
jgi:alkanesulfonate monooxygenase SsuD/methylene tetrahydromethanopterin reductase-like flavin-dependent oxidoreductase (luciferase family)